MVLVIILIVLGAAALIFICLSLYFLIRVITHNPKNVKIIKKKHIDEKEY